MCKDNIVLGIESQKNIKMQSFGNGIQKLYFDFTIHFRQVRRTLPRDDVAKESIANLFPEGIQLGSNEISADIFRIPEGMRPISIHPVHPFTMVLARTYSTQLI